MTKPSKLGVTAKMLRYQTSNLLRSRWLLAWGLFFALAADALFRFGGVQPAALLSVTTVVLLITPLIALTFGTMYVYDAREFIELLLVQPIGRRGVFVGLYLGLTLPLAGAFILGLSIPATLHGVWGTQLRDTLLSILAAGTALTAIFTGLALLIAIKVQDKVRGLGTAIALWLGFAVLYDGLVLLLSMLFADYPLERPLLGLVLANPVDLARVVLLLRFDTSALMGYTGAIFERFFSGATGLAVALGALALWSAFPVFTGMRAFQRRDF
jgi:Cu-processing system permease protein